MVHMMELTRVNSDWFKEYYRATNGKREIICILDENCVRYVIKVDGKMKSKREYDNANKKACFQAATRALNK